MSHSIEKPELTASQRLSAQLIIGLILFLTAVNLWFDRDHFSATGKTIEIYKPTLIQVTVQGEVENPGVYQVEKNTTVNNLLKQAKPKSSANLNRIKLDALITRKRTITVRPAPVKKQK